MLNEFSPQDFEEFQHNPDRMARYQECADSCLLSNFNGAIEPVIQDIISDVHDHGKNCLEDDQCTHCPLGKKEFQLATLLLLDSLL